MGPVSAIGPSSRRCFDIFRSHIILKELCFMLENEFFLHTCFSIKCSQARLKKSWVFQNGLRNQATVPLEAILLFIQIHLWHDKQKVAKNRAPYCTGFVLIQVVPPQSRSAAQFSVDPYTIANQP